MGVLGFLLGREAALHLGMFQQCRIGVAMKHNCLRVKKLQGGGGRNFREAPESYVYANLEVQ